jgi:iron(III) transport system ATP-binding protein
VADNVAFGIHHWPVAERQARVQEVLQLVDLPSLGQRFPHELSGGQQQRVALARALAGRPQLLLLDEPFSSLDVDLREHLAHELRAILQRAGATALLVTHDQQEAFAMGDMIGVMQEGRLHQWGNAYAVYHRPSTRFVADFIGHGVLAPARVVQRQGGAVLESPVGELQAAPGALLPGTYPNGECDVLLRADDIVHDDASPVLAQIVRKAFRGAEFLYTLRTPSGQTLLTHVPSHHDHAVGESIGIRVHVDHVVTFPRLT